MFLLQPTSSTDGWPSISVQLSHGASAQISKCWSHPWRLQWVQSDDQFQGTCDIDRLPTDGFYIAWKCWMVRLFRSLLSAYLISVVPSAFQLLFSSYENTVSFFFCLSMFTCCLLYRYFNRDVRGVRDFFAKRFKFESASYPSFADIRCVYVCTFIQLSFGY